MHLSSAAGLRAAGTPRRSAALLDVTCVGVLVCCVGAAESGVDVAVDLGAEDTWEKVVEVEQSSERCFCARLC